MSSFLASSGNRYSVDDGKVRFSALRTENLGQLPWMGQSQPVVAPTKTPGCDSGHRDVALPLEDVVEIALDFLRNRLIDQPRCADGVELERLLGF